MFEKIWELASYAVKILAYFVEEIIKISQYLSDAFSHLPGLFGWLPAGLAAFLMGMMGIVIIYKVAGREG